VIRTTLDTRAQAAAVQALDDAVPPTDPSGLGSAAVTVEPGTGAVTAMAENRSYAVTNSPGHTSVNYSTDAALGGSQGFQTGSSFKPFTLATWLAAGHGLNDTVDATKRGFPYADFTACGSPLRGTQPYVPGNSEGSESG
jgi:membrane peptidoglycan carboxypeptidase